MHPWSAVEQVRRLSAEGLSPSAIARATGTPRSTVRGWLAGQRPSRPHHARQELPRPEYAYVLGIYLGDGHLSAHRRGVWRLRIVLDDRYPGVIRECRDALQRVLPANRVGVRARRDGCSEVGVYSKQLAALFPQHGPGVKHRRTIALADWQGWVVEGEAASLLRGLIHSDGSRSINTIRHPGKTYRYVRYQFSNQSPDIRRLFCDACDAVDVEWRQMNAWTISVARRGSVEPLDEIVGPKY